MIKNPPAKAGDERNTGLIPGSGRSPGGGHGNPLQYSCLGNPTDRGAWWATVHEVAKSRTQLSNFTYCVTVTRGGEGNGNPLQHSCLGNPMDREAWRATVHEVAKSQTQLSLLSNNNSHGTLETPGPLCSLRTTPSTWVLPSSSWT